MKSAATRAGYLICPPDVSGPAPVTGAAAAMCRLGRYRYSPARPAGRRPGAGLARRAGWQAGRPPHRSAQPQNIYTCRGGRWRRAGLLVTQGSEGGSRGVGSCGLESVSTTVGSELVSSAASLSIPQAVLAALGLMAGGTNDR